MSLAGANSVAQGGNSAVRGSAVKAVPGTLQDGGAPINDALEHGR